MARTCESSGHREALLASDVAVCYYCFAEFPPSSITEWCDEDEDGVGQTAICPFCPVDAVVRFNGPVDHEWVRVKNQWAFG